MKNIHLIPTDNKPSSLWMTKLGNLSRCHDTNPIKKELGCNINIYITNDEEIKEGDWHFKITNNSVSNYKLDSINPNKGRYKKIILTTDQDLINCFCTCCGVQAIDDEFLEWFVKNPSCESVEIENTCLEVRVCDCVMNENCLKPGYKIIIPKEEPKHFTLEMLVDLKQGFDNAIQKSNPLFPNYNFLNKKEEPKQKTLTYTEAVKKEERIFNSIMMKQETLEEAAEKYKYNPKGDFCFTKGAKYMAERMYSEEDIKLAFEHGILFSKESVSLCKEAINTEYELFIQNIKNQTK